MSSKTTKTTSDKPFFSPRITRSRIKITTTSTVASFNGDSISNISTNNSNLVASSNKSITSTISTVNSNSTISISLAEEKDENSSETKPPSEQQPEQSDNEQQHELEPPQFEQHYELTDATALLANLTFNIDDEREDDHV